ncbi:MAG: hypothetical protein R3344_05250, partial [Acidobacteriota bacterium]|nr:hypothetical protein [Acidobacteriota bacterium]
MRTRLKILIAVVVVILLVVFFVTTKGIAPPTPNPPGTFSFGALGDAPYYLWEDMQYALVLDELDAHDLSFVVQVGDAFWRPCIDRLYLRSLEWFNALRHPVIYTPGDNEWTDCWEPGSGGYSPLDRLKRLREIYFVEPTRSLGGRRIPLETQAGDPRFAEFPENSRWSHDGIVFATVHLVGSSNARDPYPDRTEADLAESRRRTEAAAEWVRGTFAEARAVEATAVVIAFHANPSFEEAVDSVDRRPFEPFLITLEEEVET